MSPWIQSAEIEGEDGLTGDRAGFELLRGQIDQLLLQSAPHSIRLEGPEVYLHTLILSNPPPAVPPVTLKDKIVGVAGISFLIAIFLSMAFIFILGLIHLHQLLS